MEAFPIGAEAVAMQRPTILQIIPRLDTGGAERTTVEMTDAIVTAGGRALVLTEGGRMAGQIDAAGGELVTFPAGAKNPIGIYRNAGCLARLIEREGVDLVHARSRAPAWSAFVAARRTRRPFVTTYHGAYAESGPLKRVYNSVMARGDVVIANSHYTAELVRARYGTPAERIRVIYRGIDEAAFNPESISPARVAALRERWRVRADDRVILHAARLTGWKGQSVVIEAAAQLSREKALANAVVILAGDSQGRTTYLHGLEQQITTLGLGDRVRLVGHVDDVPAAFLASHVAVVASTEPEAFGRVAAEAQAMGCPVIATAIGAPPETVRAEPHVGRGEITGWLIPPADAHALARQIGSALALTAEERSAIGGRARAHVLENFSLADMKNATLGVYDQLLGTSLGAQCDGQKRGQCCNAGA
jgi:glycosyltransferase involved in cell wall biosynthesis